MNREKVIELARKAGLAYGSDEKPLSSVERFADLIEAEVAEPVPWRFYDKELGKWVGSDAPLSVRREFEAEGYKTEDLFERRTPSAKRKKIWALKL